MHSTRLAMDELVGEPCDTIFYQGNGSSQTQLLKYIGHLVKITATTGEEMWCAGRNHLKALEVIYRPFIGPEIADVNLRPFDTPYAYFNPIKVIGAAVTWYSNWCNGFHFSPSPNPTTESVVFHAPNFSQVSIGQETDMLSHRKKYEAWLKKEDRTKGLILWCVSRGTSAGFCAYEKEKYPEVRLVVLEGAIDSVQEVLPKRVFNTFRSMYVPQSVANYLTPYATNTINAGFAFFNKQNLMQYRQDGPSPLKSVEGFPEETPVVFITSKTDTVVTCNNTKNIAESLAARGKNDVYLLILENSSHPDYMFSNRQDRDCYERFIHAVYKKYNLQHNPRLAKEGESLVEKYNIGVRKSFQMRM